MNMGHGLPAGDPTVTAAFRTALVHQFLVIVFVVAALAIVWNTIRTVRYRRAVLDGAPEVPGPSASEYPEPAARRVLRIGFGLLWIVDGLLQAQPSMPLGLTGNVITPAASSSPGWVQHLVAFGAGVWNDHPVSAAASAVWIQVGIGLFLLVAPRGRWSRAAGLVSAGWGLVVWVFGEAFGGVFGQGSSWLFGSPGAAVFYVAAGALVALPDRAWETRRTGRAMVRTLGGFFVVMGVLQAWPGRGFWAGTGGTLSAMETQMSRLGQPSVTASVVRAFGTFAGGHGWLVNAVVVVALVGIGACFLSARPTLVRAGVIAGSVLGVATWVLVQDFGFFGSVGTDPNSMLPMMLVVVSGYLALFRLPARAAAAERTTATATAPSDPAGAVAGRTPVGTAAPTGGSGGPAPDGPLGPDGALGPDVRTPAAAGQRLLNLQPTYLVRAIAAIGAVAVVLVGAVPMVLAATNS